MTMDPVRKINEVIIARDRLEQRRAEVAFLSDIVDAPAETLSEEEQRMVTAAFTPLHIAVDEILAGNFESALGSISSTEKVALFAKLNRLLAAIQRGKTIQ